MKIVVLVPDLHDRPTGGTVYNRRIIEALDERGPVEVVRGVPSPDAVPAAASGPETTIVVDSLLVQHAGALRALHGAYPEAALILLAHYLHCLDPREQSSAEADAERSLLPLFDGAVTTSRYARRALVDAGLAAASVEVVPPGLDADYREPVDEDVRDGAPPELLTVANLLPGKGLRAFVDVLERLDDEAWRWTLVGDDTLDPNCATALRRRLRGSPIADRVRLPGPVPPADLRARYDRADVFVLPSRFETCSMATREAMARGCPVVAYAVGGLPDNLGDADAGILAPPDQPDALADALRALLADPARRQRLGAAARERSRSFPTWAEAGARFHAAVRSIRAAEP
jgi:hypothetical protein